MKLKLSNQGLASIKCKLNLTRQEETPLVRENLAQDFIFEFIRFKTKWFTTSGINLAKNVHPLISFDNTRGMRWSVVEILFKSIYIYFNDLTNEFQNVINP